MQTKELNLKPREPKLVSSIQSHTNYTSDIVIPPITVNFDDVPVKKEKTYVFLGSSDSRVLQRYLRHYNIPYKHYNGIQIMEELSDFIEVPTSEDRPFSCTYGCEPGESYPLERRQYCIVETHFEPKSLFQKTMEILYCDEMVQRRAYNNDINQQRYGSDIEQLHEQQMKRDAVEHAEAETQGLTYEEYLNKRYAKYKKDHGLDDFYRKIEV